MSMIYVNKYNDKKELRYTKYMSLNEFVNKYEDAVEKGWQFYQENNRQKIEKEKYESSLKIMVYENNDKVKNLEEYRKSFLKSFVKDYLIIHDIEKDIYYFSDESVFKDEQYVNKKGVVTSFGITGFIMTFVVYAIYLQQGISITEILCFLITGMIIGNLCAIEQKKNLYYNKIIIDDMKIKDKKDNNLDKYIVDLHELIKNKDCELVTILDDEIIYTNDAFIQLEIEKDDEYIKNRYKYVGFLSQYEYTAFTMYARDYPDNYIKHVERDVIDKKENFKFQDLFKRSLNLYINNKSLITKNNI